MGGCQKAQLNLGITSNMRSAFLVLAYITLRDLPYHYDDRNAQRIIHGEGVRM